MDFDGVIWYSVVFQLSRNLYQRDYPGSSCSGFWFVRKMKRLFFTVGYWLVHTAGIFPVMLKSSKNKVSVLFNDPRTPWTPWVSSRRTFLIELGQIGLILYNALMVFGWIPDKAYSPSWNDRFPENMIKQTITVGSLSTMFCILLATMIRRGEIERLLNNVCSLYFTVFKSTDPPRVRKFAYLIVYSIYTLSILVTAISFTRVSNTSFFQDVVGIIHMFIFFYAEVIIDVILIYLQAVVEELNRKIKSQFPHVDEWDWKCWSQPSGEENHRREALKTNAKSILQEYRLTYRTVANIVDQLNSVYGFQVLMMVLYNQISCLLLAFFYITVFLISLKDKERDDMGGKLMFMASAAVWCFVKISVTFHSFEIVVKEVQVTKHYVAMIDASEIDLGSKAELLEFLEEIDGSKVRFMASNVFSLDYATLYLMLTNTATYLIVVVQYLSY